MKKLICLLMAFVVLSATTFAQDKMEKKPKSETSKKAAPAKEPAKEKGGKMKKDGTPDMRYKENKKAAEKKPEGPKKKDGTPDMRHKANKEANKKK